MAKRSIQGYVELASGLGELTRSRAKEAAPEILALAGADGSRKKVAKQASKLADELLQRRREQPQAPRPPRAPGGRVGPGPARRQPPRR